MSQAELGLKLERVQSAVCGWEKGAIPAREDWGRVSSALETTVQDLFFTAEQAAAEG